MFAIKYLNYRLKMTSKKSTGKIEVDVQKLRDEGCWKRLIELTENGKVGINGEILFTF